MIQLVKRIKRMLQGTYKTAVKDGMKTGKNVTVMGGVNFGSEPYLITLGNDVRISSNCVFVNHDGGTWAFRDLPGYEDVIKYGRISIGDRTFIGCNTTILPGVSIGKRCVIGAGSVVTKDIPDGMVVCGVPARIIMTTVEYAEKSKKNCIDYCKEDYLKEKKEYLQKIL